MYYVVNVCMLRYDVISGSDTEKEADGKDNQTAADLLALTLLFMEEEGGERGRGDK